MSLFDLLNKCSWIIEHFLNLIPLVIIFNANEHGNHTHDSQNSYTRWFKSFQFSNIAPIQTL